MWVPKRKWGELICRIEEIEQEVRSQQEDTERKIRCMAKRILEEPETLSEEIKSIDDIENYICKFIHF